MKTSNTTYIPSNIFGESDNRREDIKLKFISAVESAMEGSLIRYSRRVKLLELAEKLGIERFEANLLIAQAQRKYLKSDNKSLIIRNSGNSGNVENESPSTSIKEKLFVAAAIFIIAALTDMILIRYLFGS